MLKQIYIFVLVVLMVFNFQLSIFPSIDFGVNIDLIINNIDLILFFGVLLHTIPDIYDIITGYLSFPKEHRESFFSYIYNNEYNLVLLPNILIGFVYLGIFLSLKFMPDTLHNYIKIFRFIPLISMFHYMNSGIRYPAVAYRDVYPGGYPEIGYLDEYSGEYPEIGYLDVDFKEGAIQRMRRL